MHEEGEASGLVDLNSAMNGGDPTRLEGQFQR